MFTIYTFGDPQLLREALLALATVFGLAEWWDGSSGFGLGGNMLAVALIGLLGVAIAGITTQQLRLDHLLVALILFGIGFGSKTNVQIEDIQTGASYVVADIPLGIAVVAAASSSAARNLTETMGTALQRPGVTTSVLTDGGFLDPLRTLYALRTISFSELDSHLTKSLLEYYKTCVGSTMAHYIGPPLFDQNVFQRTPDPLAYLLDTSNVLNWSVPYYTAANPAGEVSSCHAVAGLLLAQIEAMTLAGADELTAKIRLTMGTKVFDSSFSYTDIDEAANIVSRNIFSGQDFLKAALMRNFVNVGEAWRLADYGDNAAKYAVEVTGALEQQRFGAALQGTIWLQMMFPMMTFFQFVFFTLAPFIALIVVASPFTAGKTLGGYFLFGVWSYAWLPVAAVVNHYIQISLGNALEYSDVSSMGTYYTAIIGMDDFYNQLANKLTIGSNALAAVPMIVGSILFLSFQGLTSVSTGLAKGSAATRVSSTMSSPTPGVSTPLVQAGGAVAYQVGQKASAVGMTYAPSYSDRMNFGKWIAGDTASIGMETARGRRVTAEHGLTAATNNAVSSLRSVARTGSLGSERSAQINSTLERAVMDGLSGVISDQQFQQMNATEAAGVEAKLGPAFKGVFSAQSHRATSAGNTDAYTRAMDFIEKNDAQFRAGLAESLGEGLRNQNGLAGEFRETAQDLASANAEFKSAIANETSVGEAAQKVQQAGTRFDMDAVDVVSSVLRAGNPRRLSENVNGRLAGEFGADYGDFMAEVQDQFVRSGRDKSDFNKDVAGRLLATGLALNNWAAHPQGMSAMWAFQQEMGIAAGGAAPSSGLTLGGARNQLDKIAPEMTSMTERSNAQPGGRERIRGESDGIRGDAERAPVIADASRDRMGAEFDGFARQDRQFGRSNPGLVEDAAQTRAFMTEALANRSHEGNAAGMVVDLLKNNPGFRQSLNSVNAVMSTQDNSAEERNAIGASLGRLQQEVTAGGHAGISVGDIYKSYKDEGFSNKEALIATFAQLGPQKAGGDAYMAGIVGGLLGANAYQAMTRPTEKSITTPKGDVRSVRVPASPSMLMVARAGAVGGAIAVGAAAVGTFQYDQATGEAGVRGVGEAFKAEFAMANEGDGARIAAFNQRIDAATTGGEMVDIVRSREFELTESQESKLGIALQAANRIPSVVPTMNSPDPNDF